MSPLRVYLFPEGLARFATEVYEPVTSANMNKRYMHLTNYSVNRKMERERARARARELASEREGGRGRQRERERGEIGRAHV